MDSDGTPPVRDAAKDADGRSDLPGPKAFDAKSFETKGFERRRRARNWAMLAVLLGLAALFYAITLVKLAKGG
jgi:hypothetical protein